MLNLENEILNNEGTNTDLFVQKLQRLLKALCNVYPTIESTCYGTDIFKYKDYLCDVDFPQKGAEIEKLTEYFCQSFQGGIRWHSSYTLFNITPAPLFDSVAAMSIASLLNMNMVNDFGCGKFYLTEKRLARFLGSLVDWKECDGFSCSGGKATLLYAIKVGLSKVYPESNISGINIYNSQPVVIASTEGHYTIDHVCSYLGIGANAVLRAKCLHDYSIDTDDMERLMEVAINEGKKIVAVIASETNTIYGAIDDVAKIKKSIQKISDKFKLDYPIHIHADSVIGWTWLTLREKYNPNSVSKELRNVVKILENITIADSMSADFHKTALCPYPSSMFICKDAADLSHLTIQHIDSHVEDITFGDCNINHFSIENSRSTASTISAYIAILKLGAEGLGEYVKTMLNIAENFRNELGKYENSFVCLNKHCMKTWSVLFMIKFKNEADSWEMIQNSTELRNSYINKSDGFMRFIWSKRIKEKTPLISIMKQYQLSQNDIPSPAFLIYPMNPSINLEIIPEIISHLLQLKDIFEKSPSFYCNIKSVKPLIR